MDVSGKPARGGGESGAQPVPRRVGGRPAAASVWAATAVAASRADHRGGWLTVAGAAGGAGAGGLRRWAARVRGGGHGGPTTRWSGGWPGCTRPGCCWSCGPWPGWAPGRRSTCCCGGCCWRCWSCRRLRHLLVVLVAWIVQGVLIQYVVAPLVQRPRPFGVEFRTDWTGWAMPSEQVAAFVVDAGGDPVQRWCRRAAGGRPGKWVAAGLVALVALARLVARRRRAHRRAGGGGDRGRGPAARVPAVHPQRGLPDHLPARPQRPPGRRRGARGGDPAGPGGPARPGRRRRSSRSGWPARPGPPRCGSRSRATRPGTCSASCTPAATCAPTAGTSSAGSCCTGGWRTRSRSTPSGGWSSRRTTRCR